MKKNKLALIFIILLMLSVGCSKLNNVTGGKTPAKNQPSLETQLSTDTSKLNVTKDNVKNLSDDQLLKMTEEPTSNIDNLDFQDDDLTQLDSIINNQDPTSNIPTSVDLK